MACSKIELWDWKKGGQTVININSGFHIPMNYFSCGTYYFDGDFQVVKFPKGMQLYHGSGALANANVEFPTGIDFYAPRNMDTPLNSDIDIDIMKKVVNNPNKSIEFETTEYFKVSPGWFGTPETARLYSLQNKKFSEICGDKCINVYELKEDAVFFLLDNNFNIWRLLNNPNVPDKSKDQLKFMFNLSKVEVDYSDTEFGNINIKHKKRRSYRDVDLPFTNWLCTFLSKDYAGYAANTPVEKKQRYFHLEFMFCNPIKWLNRNMTNPLDWQHLNVKNAPVEISLFLEQMALYKSTNINFHAGNLLEHSIWSLLFAEQLVLNTPKYGIPDIDIQKKIAAAAFIHDIGKMDPNSKHTIKRRHDYVYFSIPEHPKTGGEYIRGTRSLPILDANMNQKGSFKINDLLGELGFKQEDIQILAKIIDLHWELGNYIKKWKGPQDIKTVDEYIDYVGSDEPITFFYALVIVSVADVLASQPYGINNLTAELNHHSRFFPFISNVPKKYRGGNLADLTAKKRNAFVEHVLDRVIQRQQPQQQIKPQQQPQQQIKPEQEIEPQEQQQIEQEIGDETSL